MSAPTATDHIERLDAIRRMKPQHPVSNGARRLLLLLKRKACGSDNAIRRQECAQIMRCHERHIRTYYGELRDAGIPVGIVRHARSDQGTYYLAVTVEEQAAVLAEYRKPMYAMLRRSNSLARHMVGATGEQLALVPTDGAGQLQMIA